jgi:hypothetical protein
MNDDASDAIWEPVVDAPSVDLESVYGPTIDTYSRADALADGVLIDVSDTAREAGILYPIALTTLAHETCVALTDAARDAGCDEDGRLWDVLMMYRYAAKGSAGSKVEFNVLVVRDAEEPTLVELCAVVGPGDAAEPVITIMVRGES